MPNPLCFVLMPFGRKRDPVGGPDIDFDAIYERGIEPAIVAAGLEPVRADREATGGIIHKAMFERLLLCDFAVADLTTANSNVFYELGVRHATRPHTTIMIFAERQPIPFDVGLARALPYPLGDGNTFTSVEQGKLVERLTERLRKARDIAATAPSVDSPLVQLLQGYEAPALAHLRTDVFREQVAYSESKRKELRAARQMKPVATATEALAAIESSLGALDGVEGGVLVDLLLSYRAVGAFDQMLSLDARLPEVLRRTVLVREQHAFALNRKAAKAPDRDALRTQAVEVLEAIIAERGPNSETCGLLGRIFKDQWEDARQEAPELARGFLRRAIDTYRRGFEADWRDAYPGINAATLCDIEGSIEERDRLVPVVRFAVEQRLRGKNADYWDHATLLELAVLAEDADTAERHLADALAAVREYWEPETTAKNLRFLAEARRVRGTDVARLDAIIATLEGAVHRKRGG